MKWQKSESYYRIPIHSWCQDVEEGALQQAANLACHPVLAHHVALMPDCHVGYGMPIGGVIAARKAILPSAVGVDIGCGMCAVETNIPAERFSDMSFRRSIQEKLKTRIPVGEATSHPKEQAWEGFEQYLDSPDHNPDFPSSLDRKNLGTLGGGNHFVELQKSDAGFAWLMIHSGSRNLGYRIENFYQKSALALNVRDGIALPDRDLSFLHADSREGQDYLRDMAFALRYARENRRRMMEAFRQTIADFVPDAQFQPEIDIHHNYVALEEHFGEMLYIHRKGATSAKAGEIGVIPGSMGTASYIVRGLGNPASFQSCSHGAGRRMSRKAACDQLTVEECDQAMEGIVCERWQQSRGFRSRKQAYDLSEAPQAYKQIDEVLDAEQDLVTPIVRLTPLAVLKG